MRLLVFLVALFQLALPVLLVLLILRSREQKKFWMTELLDVLRDENIIFRERTGSVSIPERIWGKVHTRGDVVLYEGEWYGDIWQEKIWFKSKSLSLFYENDHLVVIRFDKAGRVEIGAREQIIGKHLLGIVNREVQLAKTSRP